MNCGAGTPGVLVAVHPRLPDDEPVTAGHYDANPDAVTAAQAVRAANAAQAVRAANAPHLVALVRAAARFKRGKLVERGGQATVEEAA